MGKWMRKLIILALIFIAAIGIFILTTREEEEKTSYTVMSGASLPVLELCYEDWIINELYGYTVKMDGASMRSCLSGAWATRAVRRRTASILTA